MSNKVVISSLAMFLMLFVATLEAQERGRRGGGRGFGQQRASRTVLVRIEAVQKELEITDEQKEDLAALRGGGRQRGGGDQGEGRGRRRQGGEGDDANRQRGGQRERGQGGRGRGGQSAEQVQAEIDQLGEILLDHQVKRLNEIFVQVLGVAALQDPMVAKELDISDEQKEQAKEAAKIEKLKKRKIVLVNTTAKIVKRNKRGSKLTLVEKGGKKVKARVHGRRTKITIDGKKAKRSATKAGMTCEMEYEGSGSEATKLNCRN